MDKEKKTITAEQALDKLQKYCVYQDRCHQEVRSKLLDLGIYGDDLENVIAELIGENFLNEERFARSYVRGKFRVKKWGKIRIKQELKRRNISPYCLKKGLEEIEDEEYRNTLYELLAKKNPTIREANDFKKKGKLAAFAIGKGYESFLVWEVLKNANFEG